MKPMSTHPLPRLSAELLDRYFAGQCTPEEAAQVREAMAQNSTLAALQRWVEGEPVDVAAAWKRFVRMYWGWGDAHPATAGASQSRRPVGGWTPAHRGHGVRYTVAGISLAAALLVAGLVLGGKQLLRRFAAPAPTYTTYATNKGERATITLPDGNVILLSVASRLEVPTNYNAGNHTVRLPMGEALFTVLHHAGAPFTVMTGKTAARVLGTSFLVRHYTADATTLVAVQEGKVGVGPAVVTSRQLVEVGRGRVSRVRPASPSLFSFATGVLTVDSTRLGDAIPELDRWYGADIRLGDPALSKQAVEGRFTAGSLAELSEIMRLTFDVRVVRDGRVLTLFPMSMR